MIDENELLETLNRIEQKLDQLNQPVIRSARRAMKFLGIGKDLFGSF